uniref:Uncharacterized protein n=1 Tax=Zooxanthella nutricula TaxID=1333877 RepID=A0A7S2II62_9DINO
MDASQTDGWDPRGIDSEGGRDVQDFTPLRFVAVLGFPLYPNQSGVNGSDLERLPDREHAETVRLRIQARDSDGAATELVTPAYPLAFEERVRSQTPAPVQRCQSVQHGFWVNHSCHVVKRLSKVCLQVRQNSSGWHLYAPLGDDVYGCNPQQNWEAQTYVIDSCWGPRISRTQCAPPADFAVELTLRSSADPAIVAAELTGGRFDFGQSQAHQEVLAILLLSLGVLATLPACCTWAARRRAKGAARARGALAQDPMVSNSDQCA